MWSKIAILVLNLVTLSLSARADHEVLSPVSERFGNAASESSPDFQKHVVPLLGRLGCNGRSCHGSFQGRGGLRLSLFGYDFKMDHAALTAKTSAGGSSRINRKTADSSLVIQKPSMQIDHEGGDRFALESWEHRLLRRWIETGADGASEPRELDRLDIKPAEVVFAADLQTTRLQVVAVWHDGSQEDVTPLCRFRTNDDSVVTVDADGRLTATGRGDTHVVAFYDNGVAAVPVMHAVSDRTGSRYPPQVVASRIDGFIQEKLHKLGIVPSPLCSDSEFLRRVSIDLTGTLPAPDEITQFLADATDDKRQRKIDELLTRPAYAAWWTNKLCDFTGCNPRQQAELGQETSVQWYMWIYSRLRKNVSYDTLIAGIVQAKGRDDNQTYGDYATQTTSFFRDETATEFTQRETMPHYWTRRSLKKSDDKALAFAHSFLGIRLQCAQCHKHPFAPWTQHDFQQFSAFFDNVKFGVVPEANQQYRALAKQVGLNIRGKNGSPVRTDVLKKSKNGRVIPWRELYIEARAEPTKLSLLRSRTVDLSANDDSRDAIMQWMKEPDNPWFAQAFVNRVWASYFHVGIVDPPDDLNPANPPSHPKLLDWLSRDFVEHGYDMKWLHRRIVSTDAYQRSWKPNETNGDDDRNFSRSIPRRVPAEVAYDALKQAVAGSNQLDEVRTDLTRRAIGHLSMRLAGTYAMDVFGKPDRAANCDCERVNQPTLLQAIFLQNDPLVEQRLNDSGWLKEIETLEAKGARIDQATVIRTAWLRTVSRPPTAAEQKRVATHFSQAESLTGAMRDLLWALLNTKEFILN